MKEWEDRRAVGREMMTKKMLDEDMHTGKPRDIAEFVADAQCKLSFFFNGSISSGTERIQCAHRFRFTSRKSMAAHLGLTEAQLRGTKQGESYLSKASIAALGRFLGFDPGWPEWKTGTCVAFARKYNAENNFGSRLFACVRKEHAATPDPQLASVTLRSAKNSPAMPWPLSLDLTCMASPEEELTLWVRHARIVVKIGESGTTIPVAERKRYPVNFGEQTLRARATIEPIGDDHIPVWVLDVKDGVLGTVSLADLIQIVDIEPDDDVEVTLRVYVKDLGSNAASVAGANADEEKQVRKAQTQSLSLAVSGGGRTTASKAKAAVAQRLAVLELQERSAAGGEGDRKRLYDGWIILARDQLRFERPSEAGTHGRESDE
jgi:hypothetical protein